jgi:hypothetical protein
MEPGVTAGSDASWKQRLEGIGNGWDQNVVIKFYQHNKLARVNCVPAVILELLCLSNEDQMLGEALHMMLEIQGVQSTAEALNKYSEQEQLHLLAIMLYLAAGSSNKAMLVSELG